MHDSDDLIEGKVYLCEVWEFPPELACNGPETAKAILRFAGWQDTKGELIRVVECENGDRYEICKKPRMTLWEPIDDSLPLFAWHVEPIRLLEAEIEQAPRINILTRLIRSRGG